MKQLKRPVTPKPLALDTVVVKDLTRVTGGKTPPNPLKNSGGCW